MNDEIETDLHPLFFCFPNFYNVDFFFQFVLNRASVCIIQSQINIYIIPEKKVFSKNPSFAT